MADGLTGEGRYGATTATRFTGFAGCTGMADNKATVPSAAATPEFAAGIYRRNGSSWVSKGDGLSFPTSPSNGDYYPLAEHDISAGAPSGAGGPSGKGSKPRPPAPTHASTHPTPNTAGSPAPDT